MDKSKIPSYVTGIIRTALEGSKKQQKGWNLVGVGKGRLGKILNDCILFPFI